MKYSIFCYLFWLVGIVNAFLDARSHRRRHPLRDAATDVEWSTLLEERLRDCGSGTQARNILQEVLPKSSSRYYASVVIPAGAAQRELSDGDLAIQTRTTRSKYSILELMDVSGNREADRFSIGIGVTLVFSTVLAIAINQSPILVGGPDILRFGLVWSLVFLPLGMIGYGMRDAQALQSLLLRWQERIDPQLRTRRLQHEAGHFLMGHLLGWPISGYEIGPADRAAAVQFYPLADPQVGRDTARQLGFDPPLRRPEDVAVAARPYFRPPERGDDPTTVWPFRGVPEATLDVLTVISVSGMVAEILALGNAYGGRADLEQLREMAQYSLEDFTEQDMDTRVRFALGFAMTVLRLYLPQLDALTKVMERSGSVAECIRAIETTNTKGQRSELQRREQFRSNRSLLERIQLLFGFSEAPNIDTPINEKDWVIGKGGGDARKPEVRLAGDDPLYLALAVAAVFLAWASAGGISLH